jgi:aminopeptidase N
MISFFSRKGWGYNEDELTTTHPIRSPVANTHIAESIFDGITYSKGAATMKQLMYLMGEENFSKALADYFNKYAFKNAELDDLLRCMERYYSPKSTGITLEEWKNMWLETSSLN